MKIFSSTTLMSLGLACLTLSLVLTAYAIGISPDDSQQLLRAQMQGAELVAAQCSPAVAHDDIATMSAIVKGVTARSTDLVSAGLRRADGRLVYQFGPHVSTWGAGATSPSSSVTKISVPIASGKESWGSLEFCYRHGTGFSLPFLPRFVNNLAINPGMRLAVFVAAVGFFLYRIYLRRTLRQLDPSSVIPPRVRAMLNALAEGVVVLDKKGFIVLANESFSRATGISFDNLLGRRASEIPWVKPHTDEAADDFPWSNVLADGQSQTGAPLALKIESKLPRNASSVRSRRAEERIFMVNAAPVLGPDGGVRGAMATFDDVTEVEKANILLKESRDEIGRQNIELLKLATIDPLTSCLNRRSFLERIESQWARVTSGEAVLSVIMIDADKFKSINDRFGHSAGDSVLKDLARILIKTVASGGVICRYGGEEFCVLLTRKNLAQAAEIAEQLRAAVEAEPWQITPVTISLGVSSTEQNVSSVMELLNEADQALYTSKRSGRNRVTRWGDVQQAPAETAGGSENSPFASVVVPTILRQGGDPAAFRALASALSCRYLYTAQHSRRVADLCLMAAPGILTPDESAQLEAAALLHDMGKIGIPDDILLKPGPLTPEERDLIRQHDKFGIDLVLTAGLPAEIAQIIAAHHAMAPESGASSERRLDTTAPLASKLLAVADAYDAMTHDRPHQIKISSEDAAAELRRHVGSQFDAEVVEQFIQALAQRAKANPSAPREAA